MVDNIPKSVPATNATPFGLLINLPINGNSRMFNRKAVRHTNACKTVLSFIITFLGLI